MSSNSFALPTKLFVRISRPFKIVAVGKNSVFAATAFGSNTDFKLVLENRVWIEDLWVMNEK